MELLTHRKRKENGVVRESEHRTQTRIRSSSHTVTHGDKLWRPSDKKHNAHVAHDENEYKLVNLQTHPPRFHATQCPPD